MKLNGLRIKNNSTELRWGKEPTYADKWWGKEKNPCNLKPLKEWLPLEIFLKNVEAAKNIGSLKD